MHENRLIQFDSFEDFFANRIIPKFLIFSYLGLFLSIVYLPFDYSGYANSPYLVGVVSQSDQSATFKDLVRLGDENLYKAKETGRNRVVFGCE